MRTTGERNCTSAVVCDLHPPRLPKCSVPVLGRSKTTGCSSSSLCFLACPAFEGVELRRCGICGAQCGLPILFLVTEHSASAIHTPTARTDGSCLGMGENTGVVESRAASPVQADTSAVTLIRRLLKEGLLHSLMKKTALCRSVFPNIERWDEIVQSLHLSQASGMCNSSG